MAGLARLLADTWHIWEPLQRRSGVVPLTVAQHVADLHEVLLTSPEPPPLVGSSWGGMLALTYAARHPRNVSRVIAIGLGTFDVQARKTYRRRMAARAGDAGNLQLRELARKLGAAREPDRRARLFREICEISFRIQAHTPLTTRPEVIAYDERGYRETWVDIVRLQDKGVQPDEFRSIQVPVLQLHGVEDPHPGHLIRDSLLPFIPHLRYQEFEKCGHLPWLEAEAREEFMAALRGELQA
jgi:pimeloyl-ACP methyl ester carboxylesterase